MNRQMSFFLVVFVVVGCALSAPTVEKKMEENDLVKRDADENSLQETFIVAGDGGAAAQLGGIAGNRKENGQQIGEKVKELAGRGKVLAGKALEKGKSIAGKVIEQGKAAVQKAKANRMNAAGGGSAAA